jgi:hypothetical protein
MIAVTNTTFYLDSGDSNDGNSVLCSVRNVGEQYGLSWIKVSTDFC